MKNISVFKFICFGLLLDLCILISASGQRTLTINEQDYFEMPGLDVILFQDYYPSGHQSGITIVQNGVRVAANGDIRLGSPAEVGLKKVDRSAGTIQVKLNYPKIPFQYTIQVKAEGSKIKVTADLDQPLPADWIGKAWFQLELFPAILIGKSWNMDGQTGIFPTDSYSPMTGGDLEPYAEGKVLSVAPDAQTQRMTIKALKGNLQLVDGRSNSKAGWFVVRTPLSPDQTKGVIELDKRTSITKTVDILKINPDGKRTKVFSSTPVLWGKYLRYNYAICDFTSLKDPGMYVIQYGDVSSNLFKISNDIYERYVWQPTLEYFLPVQMCHMRIEQGSRVWHDWCHLDDAIMAPLNHVHFDGYRQGPETFTKYQFPQHVPFLDHGGWHDAGDYDLRIESQSVTTWRLAMMHEQFGIDLDATTIDQQKRIVTIHKPDGISDVLQQVEHGVLTILSGYRGLGRLYRGMISPTNKQYGLQGDGSAQTDNLIYSSDLPEDVKTMRNERIPAAAELYLTTKNKKYLDAITAQKEFILTHMQGTAWAVGMVYKDISDITFRNEMDNAVKDFSILLEKENAETPFGVPYKPDIWGAGWTIQSLGVRHYFLVTGFPGIFKPDRIYNAMNFILGCHPGINTASFASGVGVKSLTAAYGVNRADLSYIPGGVASGTAIIRPDLPELKENWSFLWQTEYVMGGGETDFMFLVLATNKLLKK